MIYLASPYFHPDSLIREAREHLTAKFAYVFIAQGVPLFSPIVYGYRFTKLFIDVPLDAASWAQFNDVMLHSSSDMWVLRLQGWDKSIGISREIALADTLGIEVQYKDLADAGL